MCASMHFGEVRGEVGPVRYRTDGTNQIHLSICKRWKSASFDLFFPFLRIFHKIKSRSAHMKTHVKRPDDDEKLAAKLAASKNH